MAVATYDPSQVAIVFGPVVFSGFAEGSVVRIEYNADSYSLQMGLDGKGTRTKSSNRSARVTASLMQSSATNDLLSAIYQADDLAGQGVYPLMIKDGSGRTLFMAETAWITRLPATEFASAAGAREWVLETDDMRAFIGGN